MFFFRYIFHIYFLKELELTAEGDEVYKKVGTVLYPQDRQETIQILAKEESLLKDEMYVFFK